MCFFESNVWSAGVSVTNAWIYNIVCHFLLCFCVCSCVFRATMECMKGVRVFGGI